MPPARSASAAPRHQRPARAPIRPTRVAGKPAVARVRWDRVGRGRLLVVLGVVGGLYAQHALSSLSTRAEANREAANVQRLSRENAALTRQHRSRNAPATITRDGRALGMVKPGERPYAITGLPGN